MKVLVINCGSSSLKYQLIDMTTEESLAQGLVERIGIEGSVLTQKVEGRDKYIVKQPMADHKDAIKLVLEALVDEKNGVISSMDEISAVGHRVVHGGEKYNKSVIIDAEVKAYIEECFKLAPLHNPANMIGINACEELMPNTPMVAVFDTAFHQTMPKHAYMYAIPQEYYNKYGIRKYGFHGTSHKYVSQRAAEMLGKNIEDTKIIVCHLGNGASVCAVDGGKSVETSMGFTPLAGLIMGTRSGDMDPAVVTFLMEKEGLSAAEMNDMMNKKSGVAALSGLSSDFREIEDGVVAGDEACRFTMDAYQHRVVEYIGAYAAAMNGVDAICFAGGLGENNAVMRQEIANMLTWLGVELDQEKNKCRGIERDLTTESSKVKMLLIPTNEELVIARDTVELVSK